MGIQLIQNVSKQNSQEKVKAKLKLYKMTVIQIIWAPCEMKKIYRKLARTLVKHNRHCRSKFENLRGCCDILESSRESA